jgi:hypothetical protein
MSNDSQTAPRGHYSASNPVPNIHRFVENLDKDKRERDARIEAQMKEKQSDVQDHKATENIGISGTRKKVTDPTTGRQVEIEDVNEDFMRAVEDPKVNITKTTYWSKTNSS